MLRPLRYLRRKWKWIAVAFVLTAVAVNLIAARHARAFLVYAPEADVVQQPEQLTTVQKLGMLVNGISIPRPKNTSTPASLQLAFSTHRIELGSEWIEVWELPAAGPSRGVVLMFPGYSSAKSSLLPETAAFHAMSFRVMMVDFRGAGGSSGSDNTLGVREAEDVAAAARFAREGWPQEKQVLFGRSMGAAAVLRAVAHHRVSADAIVLECPFDRMLNAVRNRFEAMGIPSFPGAQLLLFWGGRRLDFDGFEHNPSEYAIQVKAPALMLAGSVDKRAKPEQVRAVYDQLRGPKRMHVFEGVGHEPMRVKAEAEWDQEVSAFLREHAP